MMQDKWDAKALLRSASAAAEDLEAGLSKKSDDGAAAAGAGRGVNRLMQQVCSS